jgi:hypothetical protein
LWFRESGKATGTTAEIKKYVDEGYEIVSFDFRVSERPHAARRFHRMIRLGYPGF